MHPILGFLRNERVTKEILLSHTRIDGTATTEEGSSGGLCYRITRQSHTLRWSAQIDTHTEVTESGPVRFTINHVAKTIEIAGATGTILGGAIFVVGLFVDSTVIGLPAGLTLNGIGAGIATFSGIFWALGGIVNYFSGPETTITNERTTERGSKNFDSATVEAFECLPGTTYTSVNVPSDPQSPEEAEDACIIDVLNSL